MILVTGATGNVGAELIGVLLRAGESVRALVRSADTVLPDGAERAVGDLNRPQTLTTALAGASGVFLLSGYDGVASEIGRSGVQRVVLLSGGAAVADNLDNPISRYMLSSEDAARRSGVEWTILRPYEFMSNTFRWLPQLRAGDVIRLPFADRPVAAIDPFDIAAVAAAALLTAEHGGAEYRLSGPDSLLPADRVAMLGAALGRELRFEPQRDDEARAEMRATMPDEYVDALLSFSGGQLDESVVLPTVSEVTGAPPRTYVKWASAHVGAFA